MNDVLITGKSMDYDMSEAVSAFRKIQERVASGADINEIDDRGCTCLTNFIELFYNVVEIRIGEECKGMTDKELDAYVHPWIKAGLAERGLLNMFDWFFENGIDPNGDRMIYDSHDPLDAGTDSALEIAVAAEDYPMIEYLLEHGADPNKRISIDEFPGHRPDDPENWYMDDIDIKFMNYVSGERAQLCADIANLLLRHGQIYYGGLCIDMSEDGRKIENIHGIRYLH